jgi:hypothetical protein
MSSPNRRACGESREGNGGGGRSRVPHDGGEREKEVGVVWGRQLDRGAGMALGDVVGGGSARSWRRRAGEQGRAAGRGRRGAAWLTGGALIGGPSQHSAGRRGSNSVLNRLKIFKRFK